MEKFFNEKCGLLYWNADLMWTFLSKKVHMWTFGAKCGPIWQHCYRLYWFQLHGKLFHNSGILKLGIRSRSRPLNGLMSRQ